ncbi:MAG TPA: ribonuclease H-like domain-containing protein [Candidatus Absconditabacterales bacterium]|nr:ribonuclease H-like domain-containing protein [Candidatus Absconditabacterales bacterium]
MFFSFEKDYYINIKNIIYKIITNNYHNIHTFKTYKTIMYKKFSLEEIEKIKNNFIPHLYSIVKKERCQGINDLVKHIFKEGNSVYFFERGEPFFKIAINNNILEFTDEIERIQLFLAMEEKGKLQSLLKTYIVQKEKQTGQKTIEQILYDEFKTGNYSYILDKPYMVFDIETTMGVGNNLDSYKFLLAYAMRPGDEKMSYHYIDINNLNDFAKTLTEFEGYIIGFNNFAFDNPISIKQGGFGEKELGIINKKSLDIFQFIRNISGKRIGLNKLSETLIGIQKTLESGTKGELLWKQYQETGDKKHLEELKKYCKNDVRMTAFVLLYLLHFKKIFIEGEEITFNIEDFVKLAKPKGDIQNEDDNKFSNQSIF